MSNQTFGLADIWVICILVLLEGLLSADNVLVLAMMVKHLPAQQQRNALTFGLGGAFVFRAIAICLVSFFLQLWWLQLGGALYLLFLTYKHFRSASDSDDVSPTQKGFWRTVVAVELTDIAFAADSVLAGVGMVHDPHKLWVVYCGSIIGVILLRFVSHAFLGVLRKYPMLDVVAYALVGWVGLNLLLGSLADYQSGLAGTQLFLVPRIPDWLFWSGMAIIAFIGSSMAIQRTRSQPEASNAETS
jgi:YkoY family integral membrane protein